MTVELNVWNREKGKYEVKEVIEQEFVTLDFNRHGQYQVSSIYTHPFSPEVRIFADPREEEKSTTCGYCGESYVSDGAWHCPHCGGC